MRPSSWIVICCMLVAGSLAGASIASAEDSMSEPSPSEVEAVPNIEVTAPGSVVTAEGKVLNDPSLMGSKTSSLLVGCAANFICIYSGTEYTNPYVAIECAVAATIGLSGNRFSATNRCGNKSNWLRVNGTATACMNPGGNRPHPGAFNEVFVPVNYGAFC